MNIVKSQILILLLIGTLSFASVSAEFNVSKGTTLKYEVIQSEHKLTEGINSGEGTGLRFGSNLNPVGLVFKIKVTSVIEEHVAYDYDVNGVEAYGVDTAASTYKLNSTLFSPYTYEYGFSSEWDQQEVELGPQMQLQLFFLEPVNFDEYLQDLHDNCGSITPKENWVFTEISAFYNKTDTIHTFDWTLNAEFNNTISDRYLNGTFTERIAYDSETSVLMGYKVHFNYTGSLQGESLKVYLQQQIEMLGYDLDYNIYSGLNIYWASILSALIVVGIFVVLRKKRSK